MKYKTVSAIFSCAMVLYFMLPGRVLCDNSGDAARMLPFYAFPHSSRIKMPIANGYFEACGKNNEFCESQCKIIDKYTVECNGASYDIDSDGVMESIAVVERGATGNISIIIYSPKLKKYIAFLFGSYFIIDGDGRWPNISSWERIGCDPGRVCEYSFNSRSSTYNAVKCFFEDGGDNSFRPYLESKGFRKCAGSAGRGVFGPVDVAHGMDAAPYGKLMENGSGLNSGILMQCYY